MAFLKRKTQNGVETPPKDGRTTGLGRGYNSLSGDNAPKEKRPLVVRRGAVTDPRRPIVPNPDSRVPKKTVEPAGVGGRVVIKTDTPPTSPVHSGRSSRKGTTVLIRTERDDPPKKYRVNERIVMRDPHDTSSGRPIVINPRKKK